MEDLFCKIIKGELPSYRIAEKEHALAILDRGPISEGHMLILPKAHIADITEMTSEAGKSVMELARDMALLLKKTFGYEDFKMLATNGPSMQEIRHFHMHIYGPKSGDEPLYKTYNSQEALNDSLEITRQKLVDHLHLIAS